MTMSYRAARGKLIGMGQDYTLTGKTVTTVVVENELVKAENGPEIIVATTFKDLDIQVCQFNLSHNVVFYSSEPCVGIPLRYIPGTSG